MSKKSPSQTPKTTEPASLIPPEPPAPAAHLGGPKPTLGRIVLVEGFVEDVQVLESTPAIITRVHSDTCIDVTAFPPGQLPRAYTSVGQVGECDRLITGTQWSWPPRN